MHLTKLTRIPRSDFVQIDHAPLVFLRILAKKAAPFGLNFLALNRVTKDFAFDTIFSFLSVEKYELVDWQ